jgi:hypothetical protein
MFKLLRILFLLLVLIQIAIPRSMKACDCIGESTVKGELKASDIVVVGKVLAKNVVEIAETISWGSSTDTSKMRTLMKFHESKYTVLLTHKYKGRIKQDTVTIVTGMGGGDCGFKFEIGKDYIIYAQKETNGSHFFGDEGNGTIPGVFRTNICRRTMEFNQKEIDELEKNIK